MTVIANKAHAVGALCRDNLERCIAAATHGAHVALRVRVRHHVFFDFVDRSVHLPFDGINGLGVMDVIKCLLTVEPVFFLDVAVSPPREGAPSVA